MGWEDGGADWKGGVCVSSGPGIAVRRLVSDVATASHNPQLLLTLTMQDLPGVFSAREFVWWYNGHPAYADLPGLDLSRTRSVAIAGLGNVAGGLAAAAADCGQQVFGGTGGGLDAGSGWPATRVRSP